MPGLNLNLGWMQQGAAQAQQAVKGTTSHLQQYAQQARQGTQATSEFTGASRESIVAMITQGRMFDAISEGLQHFKAEFLTFVGVYSANQVFQQINREIEELEDRAVRLANRLGSQSYANQVVGWMDEMRTQLPVTREELQQFLDVSLQEFGLTPQMEQLQGALAGALGPGEDMSSVMQTLQETARTGDIQGMMESFRHTLSFQQIAESLEGATSMQERFVALTQLLAQEYGQTVNRELRTTEGLWERLYGLGQQFWRSIVGLPGQAGLYEEVRQQTADFVNFFLQREELITDIGRSIGDVLRIVVDYIGQLFGSLGDWMDRAIQGVASFRNRTKETVHPFIAFMAIITERFRTLVAGFVEGLSGFAHRLANALDPVIQFFGELVGFDLGAISGHLRDIVGYLTDHENVRQFGNALGQIAGVFFAWTIGKGILGMVASGLSGIVNSLRTIFGLGGTALAAGTAGPLAGLLSATAVVGATLLAWETNFLGFRDTVEEHAPGIAAIIRGIGRAVEWVADRIMDLEEALNSIGGSLFGVPWLFQGLGWLFDQPARPVTTGLGGAQAGGAGSFDAPSPSIDTSLDLSPMSAHERQNQPREEHYHFNVDNLSTDDDTTPEEFARKAWDEFQKLQRRRAER